MLKYQFKLTFISTLLLGIGIIILVGLGLWQLERLQQKERVLSTIEQRMNEDMIIFPDDITDISRFDYANGAVRGRFDFDHEFFIRPRRFEGQNGYHVLTPFERLNGDWLLVNRGFVADDDVDYMRRPSGRAIILNGVLHVPDDRNRFTPANTAGDPYVYATDIDFIEKESGLRFSSPLVLYATESLDGPPIGGQLRMDIPNDHLEYAFFWFTMAGMMLFFYFAYFVRQKEDHD